MLAPEAWREAGMFSVDSGRGGDRVQVQLDDAYPCVLGQVNAVRFGFLIRGLKGIKLPLCRVDVRTN